jgi:hypothetical protein
MRMLLGVTDSLLTKCPQSQFTHSQRVSIAKLKICKVRSALESSNPTQMDGTYAVREASPDRWQMRCLS